jgi:hypothetical protein
MESLDRDPQLCRRGGRGHLAEDLFGERVEEVAENDLILSIGGRTRGAGVAAAHLLGSKFFNMFSFLAKDSTYLVIFHCLFFESLPLSTLNQC